MQADESNTNIGSPVAMATTCSDGSYVLRVPPDESGYFIVAAGSQDTGSSVVTWNGSPNGTFYRCEGVRVPAPTAGETTSGLDFQVPQGVSISGAVTTQLSECTSSSGGEVVVDDGMDHECSAGSYDYSVPEGTYRIYGLPPATVVEGLRACVRQPGFDPQCWNVKSAPAFDPLVIAPGESQASVDFCLANCQSET